MHSVQLLRHGDDLREGLMPAGSRQGEGSAPLEEGIVAGLRDLLSAVLEQHGALSERSRRTLQHRVHLWRIRIAQPPTLPLHPPASRTGAVHLSSCKDIRLTYCVPLHLGCTVQRIVGRLLKTEKLRHET